MASTIIILIVSATVITSICNVAKPAYKKFTWKYAVSITVLLSFILWEIAAFSVAPYLSMEVNNWILFLLWLALGTWSNIFYDLWEIVKGLGVKLNEWIKAIEKSE